MGWSKDPGPPGGGEFPRHCVLKKVLTVRTLSVFIDESGDFGPYEAHSPSYIVSLVYHDQSIDISDNLADFSTHLRNLKYDYPEIHTGPLIRREAFYKNTPIVYRKRLFNALFNFTRKLSINYSGICIEKEHCSESHTLAEEVTKQLNNLIHEHIEFFNKYQKIIVYYDNGQAILTNIISTVFNSFFTNVEFRKVKPSEYRLFQIADMICTFELLSDKAKKKAFSASEISFFDSIRDFKKNYLKWILRKKI